MNKAGRAGLSLDSDGFRSLSEVMLVKPRHMKLTPVLVAQFPHLVQDSSTALPPHEGELRAITLVINRTGGPYVSGPSFEQIADALAVAVGRVGSMADYLHSTVSHLEERGIRDTQLWRIHELVAERLAVPVATVDTPNLQ